MIEYTEVNLSDQGEELVQNYCTWNYTAIGKKILSGAFIEMGLDEYITCNGYAPNRANGIKLLEKTHEVGRDNEKSVSGPLDHFCVCITSLLRFRDPCNSGTHGPRASPSPPPFPVRVRIISNVFFYYYIHAIRSS